MTTRESVWTEQDRAEVLALQLYRNALCPCGCGLKSEDTLSDETDGPSFRAHRIACRARMVLIDAQDRVAADTKNPYGPARLWTVEKIAR